MPRVPTNKATELEEQLRSFIKEFAPQHQAVIRAARKALRKRFPSATELVYDNYRDDAVRRSLVRAEPNDKEIVARWRTSSLSKARQRRGGSIIKKHSTSFQNMHNSIPTSAPLRTYRLNVMGIFGGCERIGTRRPAFENAENIVAPMPRSPGVDQLKSQIAQARSQIFGGAMPSNPIPPFSTGCSSTHSI